MSDILTPLQALVALLAECDMSLDYRTSFRRAMSDAHCAIVNSPRAALHGSIVLGGVDDEPELSFGDLFGEPDPSAFNPQVLAIAQRAAVADGAAA